MLKKINYHSIIWILAFFISLFWVFYYSFVIWAFENENYIKSNILLTKNIYLNSSFKDNLIIYNSEKDLSNYNLVSNTCRINSNFLTKKENFYIFSFKFMNSNCKNALIHLQKDEKVILSSYFDLNLINDFSLLNELTDYKSDELREIKKNLLQKMQDLNSFSENINAKTTNLDFLQTNRFYNEYFYKKEKINYILNQRKEKYLIPVKWYNLPKNDKVGKSIVPNAKRPYRIDTTDGIHHGWDIIAPIYTPVRSLSDWIIIRVVKNFKFKNLQKLKKWWSLTKKDWDYNLDIYRWNQVWLKTMKWDVVFYSHLDSVNSEIKEWITVRKNQNLWKIWITWVPDENYKNYHLHFEISKNPKIIEKVWNYSFEEIMSWDYEWQWLKIEEIINLQNKIFQN